MEELLLVKYGEISLKGKNRREFEEALLEHIKWVLREHPGARLERAYGRLYIHSVPGEERLLSRLARCGIVAVAPALRGEDLAEIRPAAVEAAKRALATIGTADKATFKAESRRSLKSFPLKSPELNHQVGSAVLTAGLGLTVDVHDPTFIIRVEVRETGTFVYWTEVKGMGGLPLAPQDGASSSPGYRQPVAAYWP